MFYILRYPSLLKSFCLEIVVDQIDIKYLQPYTTRWNDITMENRPNFGPFENMESTVLILIIEELVRREELRYEHLKILLPREAVSLTCDENTEFHPFQLDTLELISKRCPDFQVLHYHFVKDPSKISEVEKLKANSTIFDVVPQLKSLQKINLTDTPINSDVIRIISARCPNLNYLNLRNTGLDDLGLHYIHDEMSVIKYSLTTLIIEETDVSTDLVGKCLVNLKNLTDFQFDKTIETCLILHGEIKNYILDAVPEFKTNIFKSKLKNVNSKLLTPEFLTWFIQMFPKIKHLILFSLPNQIHTSLINSLAASWKCITHLELSSSGLQQNYKFSELSFALESCKEKLIVLKLESFSNVNIFYLGSLLHKLEKLSFVNCTFLSGKKKKIFKSLRVLKIAFFQYRFQKRTKKDLSNRVAMESSDLISILSTETLEKVLIYDQLYFDCETFHTLIENGALKKLRELEVFFCPVGVCCFISLTDGTFSIENIVVGSCPFIRIKDTKPISNLIKQNNLTISFMIVKEIPYHLRWLVLDVKNPVSYLEKKLF